MTEYAWPVPGYTMSTAYGIKGSHWRACGWHTGIDIAAPQGTPILAIEDGDIRQRSYGSAFGEAFALSPDGPGEWFYAHCSWHLPFGTRVRKGDVIAKVGSTGNVTGPHLHLERHTVKGRWVCAEMVNPMVYLAGSHTSKDSNPQPDKWLFDGNKNVYQKFLKVDGHNQNADGVSDSVKALQEMLNRHSMPGGKNIPVSGKYWTMTDAEVRLCQRLHLPPEDPEMKSFVGPKQWEHLKAATGSPYNWVPDAVDVPAENRRSDGSFTGKWFVPPSIKKLISEVDARWPDRDKSSDGTVGDLAHSKSKSEHNPVGHEFGPEFGTDGAVHAVDITADNVDLVAEVMRAAIGDSRVWYVIHNGFIYSKTYDWAERPYKGGNPHTTHIHISLRADDAKDALHAENDTSQWLKPAATVQEPPAVGETDKQPTPDVVAPVVNQPSSAPGVGAFLVRTTTGQAWCLTADLSRKIRVVFQEDFDALVAAGYPVITLSDFQIDIAKG